MQIQLFGGVKATGEDGANLDVGPSKCQAVLAVLTLQASSAVPVTRIIELVWGEHPPRTADKTLQSYVTRLRKGLGATTISRVGAAYQLELPTSATDVGRFRIALSSGETTQALAEWTGTPMAGLNAPGLMAAVNGLTEQWLGAVEVDTELHIEEHAVGVIGPLTELTAAHPFREGLWALLMTALYRVGRQAEALAAYRTARTHLVEELGVEPGPRLRELEAQILGQDAELSANRSFSDTDQTPYPTGTVTFGFCEVVGASNLWSDHRHHMVIAMARHDEIVMAATEAAHGHIFSSGGDSFCVAFDRASAARDWATSIQSNVSEESWPQALSIRIRIGLHTGEPEERRSRYFGPSVNLTKALVSAANGGQTVLSHVTAVLLGTTDIVDLGSYRLAESTVDQKIFQLGETDHPPLQIQDDRRGNLPLRTSRLFGRADDLAAIAQAIDASPVVTLVGPGGIGKTRLALAAGHRDAANRQGGVWFVELAGVGQSDDVVRTVASVLSIKENPERTLIASVILALQRRHILLVLDNCEHVIEGAATLARQIADACSDVRILATSREGLGIAHERLIAVSPLAPTGPAADLFNDRALAASSAFDPDSSRAEVEEICRRLDGVPLAIELAAARIRSLEPAELVERLSDRLRLLTGGRRATVERHRTLRATIQWSYDLLSNEEQRLFQRLSIFAGAFTLRAVEEIASEPSCFFRNFDIDELLGSLVDRSMVIAESGPFGRRFRLLETMRQFGAEHLTGHLQADELGARHAHWCLSEVREAERLLSGHDEIVGVGRLQELWPNLRAAFEWACAQADDDLAFQLLQPVGPEISLRSRSEVWDWVERLLEITKPGNHEALLFGLQWTAHRYMLTRDSAGFEQVAARYEALDHPMVDYARAVAHDEDETLLELGPPAVAYLRERGQNRAAELAEISSVVGPYLACGRFEEFDVLVAEKVAQYRADGPPTLLHWVLFMQGYSASFQGHDQQASEWFRQAIDVDIPDRSVSLSKPVEARIALEGGERRHAFVLLRAYLEELIETDNLMIGTLASNEYVAMMCSVGEFAKAARILGHLESNTNFSRTVLTTFGPVAQKMLVENPTDEVMTQRREGASLDPLAAIGHMSDVLQGLIADL